MNLYAIQAIYRFEMARTFRTVGESLLSPVLTTSLYFIVFGAAIGARMGDIDGVTYAAFIIPGLIMLSLLNESISNASFGIYMPKWSGTIFELLSAPVSTLEVVLGYVGAATTKSLIIGLLIMLTARFFVPYQIAQKLHACTEPLPNGNDRVRDIVDIWLLEALLEPGDLPSVRTACIDTFRRRQRHAWPPTVSPSPSWAQDYSLLTAEHPDAPPTLDDAIEYLTQLVTRIDSTS